MQREGESMSVGDPSFLWFWLFISWGVGIGMAFVSSLSNRDYASLSLGIVGLNSLAFSFLIYSRMNWHTIFLSLWGLFLIGQAIKTVRRIYVVSHREKSKINI
jgi:hypothetical protein